MDLLDYEEGSEADKLSPSPADVAGPSGLNPPSGKDTSEKNDLKEVLAQMQKQINQLADKISAQDQGRPHVSDVESVNSPFNQLDHSLDFDEEIQNLLSKSQVDSAENSGVITIDEAPKEAEEQKLFSDLVSDLNLDAKFGPGVEGKVASLLNNICINKLSPAKLKEKCDKYRTPENVKLLQTTQVNKLVWDNLKTPTRTIYIKLQKIQMLNVKAMSALTGLLNEVLLCKVSLDKESIITGLTDALVLLGSANVDLNYYRRELIRQEVKSDFKNLCDKSTPISTLLFGDELSQKLRDISDANKLSMRCLAPRGRGRNPIPFRGKARGRGRYAQRYQPFLGKRQMPTRNYGQPSQERSKNRTEKN